MKDDDIILSSGARTPFGDFGKSLREVPLHQMGVHVVQACLERAGLPAAKVDHLVFGNTAPVIKPKIPNRIVSRRTKPM